MARLLDDGQNHPFASILVPGLVKFFGTESRSHATTPHVDLPSHLIYFFRQLGSHETETGHDGVSDFCVFPCCYG